MNEPASFPLHTRTPQWVEYRKISIKPSFIAGAIEFLLDGFTLAEALAVLAQEAEKGTQQL